MKHYFCRYDIAARRYVVSPETTEIELDEAAIYIPGSLKPVAEQVGRPAIILAGAVLGHITVFPRGEKDFYRLSAVTLHIQETISPLMKWLPLMRLKKEGPTGKRSYRCHGLAGAGIGVC